jgi:subtilisin family serine protease
MKQFFRIFSLLMIVIFAVSAPLGLPANAAQPEPDAFQGEREQYKSGVYIVQMVDDPVVAYKGGVPGLKATKPGRGQKINPRSQDVIAYAGYLDARHGQLLSSVGGGRKLYDYYYSYNGFAAELTGEQAAALAILPDVLSVEPDEVLQLDTSSTPGFLGLNAPGGMWDMLGGVGSAGEGIIIGIVDGGIWPEHPSFSDRTRTNANDKDGKLAYRQIPGWHGKCVPGEEFTAANCNQKLIGAQYYNAGWGGNAGIDAQLPWEYNSPRDFGGHGTHTASTAGGNYGVNTIGAASAFGSISGIAPRARISAYKVCWETGGGGSCFSSDSVAAIDQAVADGVDVINFSISGSSTNFLDPVEVAFLFAADAGVFVATSAGNSGPTSSTVAHPGPWLTTVAAGTHNRDGAGSVTLGNEVTYYGASVATAVGPAPLIDSSEAGLPGADPTAVALCFSTADTGGTPVLDPALVAGKIVVCDRGVTARVNKSLAIQEAGGIGMILVNTAPSSINADFHFVPTVHLQHTDRPAIKAYAASSGATATINTATIVDNAAAPFTASFSSRGPLLAGGGDLLKPDLIAPGQDVLAGVAPPGNSGRLFDLYSGTSMSSPHVAGLAALLKDLHPDWSPMMIKSALMTTAYDVLDGGTPAPNTNPVLIFRQGAGHVQPNSAADPGLVFDAGWMDWLGFLCGTGQLRASYCPSISIDPSNLNTASIAIGDMAGTQTVKRTVTNVASASAIYNVSVTGMGGINVNVNPESLTLAPGDSASFDVTFTRTSAALNAYTGGQMTWSDGTHHVRIPLVVRPVALAVPVQVYGTGDPISYNVTFGYSGDFTATGRGLVPANITAGTVDQDPDQTFNTADSTGTVMIPLIIPAGTTYARFSLFDEDVTPGTDLDLYIYQDITPVGVSASGTSAEEVNILFTNPTGEPIALTAYVHGWGIAGGVSSPFKLHFWALGTNAENMTVSAHPSAELGTIGTINLTFSELDAATKYLGSVAYGGATGMPNPTIVRVDTP